MLLALGTKEAEVPSDKGPVIVGSSKAMSEDDKMLLNCLEHVSRMSVCYLVGQFYEIDFRFSPRALLYRRLK